MLRFATVVFLLMVWTVPGWAQETTTRGSQDTWSELLTSLTASLTAVPAVPA